LSLAHVVKHTARHSFHIRRYLLRGSATMLVHLRNATQGDGTLNTACIERLNGTFRAYLAPFVCRTHGLARQEQTITCAVFLLGCVYNFCRAHSTLKHSTPAMAAHLTDHVWSVSELLWFRPHLCFLSSTG
jgi:hypothetical protein